MPAVAIYGQVTHTRRVAMSVIDAFARELGVRGAFAPPQGEIALEITAQSEPDIRTFVPPFKLWSVRNASGFVIIDGTYTQVGRGTSDYHYPMGGISCAYGVSSTRIL